MKVYKTSELTITVYDSYKAVLDPEPCTECAKSLEVGRQYAIVETVVPRDYVDVLCKRCTFNTVERVKNTQKVG